jgi:hypothetical protein
MKLRTASLLSLALLPLVAQADWVPRHVSDEWVATVGASVNGYSGSVTWAENRFASGPLGRVAGDVLSITRDLENELNQQVREVATSHGYTYLGGGLKGEATVSLQPNGAGYLTTTMTGLSYEGLARGTERKYGISFTCFAYLKVNNIVATAQIGSATGAVPEANVGMTANVSANTSCDSSIGWIPIIGSLVNKYAERLASGIIKTEVRDVISTFKDKLFFERDANAYVGLNRLVPLDKVIYLPNGTTFMPGQWLANQLNWLLTNTSMTVVLGRGADTSIQPGSTTPEFNVFTGNVVRVNLAIGGVSLAVDMRQEIGVIWEWRCSYRPCPIP